MQKMQKENNLIFFVNINDFLYYFYAEIIRRASAFDIISLIHLMACLVARLHSLSPNAKSRLQNPCINMRYSIISQSFFNFLFFSSIT